MIFNLTKEDNLLDLYCGTGTIGIYLATKANKVLGIEIIKDAINDSNKIIYVSCDPMTLVRDLNILKEKYNIKEITPFDMFTNTYHVENVCL